MPDGVRDRATVPGMIGWLLRVGLIRFLGRRVILFLMVYDAIRFIRAMRRRWMEPGAPP
jgi:hypothetical protein